MIYEAIRKKFLKFSLESQLKRKNIFLSKYIINEETKILDLGGSTGDHIHRLLQGTKVNAGNVYVADIFQWKVEEANKKYGYRPVIVTENGILPYSDDYFDIVYCNSVIEHVTTVKDSIWTISNKEFVNESIKNQKRLADEIRRVSKQYYVQTPNK